MIQRNTLNSFIITAFFNTGIALLLTYMVLDKSRLVDIFFISQFIGLSICAFVTVAMKIPAQKGLFWTTTGILLGLVLGILFGSMLSWAYMHQVRGMNTGYFFKDVLLDLLVFGVIFGGPIIY